MSLRLKVTLLFVAAILLVLATDPFAHESSPWFVLSAVLTGLLVAGALIAWEDLEGR